MAQYIMTADKNGKARYYKVVDGKKKVISKAEYEANAAVVETTETETVETVETAEATEAETVETETTETTEATEAETVETEATETTETAAEAAESNTVEQTALAIVKSIIEATGSKHASKVRLQVTKHCVLINYRNCMICSLVFNADHAVTALRFMGDTLETRKKAWVYEYGDLNAHKEEIIRQAAFIDWWYQNPTAKAA